MAERRVSPGRLLVSLALSGATSLAPGCAATLGYVLVGPDPFVGVRADVAGLAAGNREKPWFFPLFGPLFLAEPGGPALSARRR